MHCCGCHKFLLVEARVTGSAPLPLLLPAACGLMDAAVASPTHAWLVFGASAGVLLGLSADMPGHRLAAWVAVAVPSHVHSGCAWKFGWWDVAVMGVACEFCAAAHLRLLGMPQRRMLVCGGSCDCHGSALPLSPSQQLQRLA